MDIKTLRGKLGLTQEELARKLGVSWGTVARWEAGKSKPSKLAQKVIEDLIKDSEKEGGER
ncbi:MAG: helix-turn-helix domain-containing protein [Candidatus Contubernalis sp.]|nr:helix-turn-helix domain-containing protein [Candidatus Contubernalis sp.]